MGWRPCLRKLSVLFTLWYQGKQVYAGGGQLNWVLFEKNTKNVITITFSHIEPLKWSKCGCWCHLVWFGTKTKPWTLNHQSSLKIIPRRKCPFCELYCVYVVCMLNNRERPTTIMEWNTNFTFSPLILQKYCWESLKQLILLNIFNLGYNFSGS